MTSDDSKPSTIAGGALSVPMDAIEFGASRSSGPGGQNVNKQNTRVELRVLISAIQGFTPPIRQRFEMLRQLLEEACRLPKPRRATKPSRGSKRRRIEGKKRRGETKAQRRPGAVE